MAPGQQMFFAGETYLNQNAPLFWRKGLSLLLVAQK